MNLAGVTFQLAAAVDAGAIARLSRDLIEEGLAWSWRTPRVLASIRNPRANVVVARTGQPIAGFGIMRYGDDEAHLDLLAVVPGCRAQGLGRRLVEWLEKPARLGGITAVFLEVRAANLEAQAFYEKLGYRQCGELRGYYQGLESAVRMRRDIGAAVDSSRS
jgi:ribosomal-protein-alanine N-acetyltransferase